MTRVALIGLGLVGTALSERLLAAGHTVRGFDIAVAQRQALAQRGGVSVDSAGEAVRGTDVCLLSLPTSDVSLEVLQEVNPELDGLTVIDMTTGDPAAMEQIASGLAARRSDYLDATIVGSSSHVRSGTCQILVGGSESAFQRWRTLLECLSEQVYFLGPSGSGARMKLVANLVLGLHRAVLAEGLVFAEHLGVSPEKALEVLQGGLAYSRVMDRKGPRMLARNFEPEARLSQHHKDVRLILQAASELGLELPLSHVHSQLLARAEELGLGNLDNSAIIDAFARPVEPTP